MTDRLKQKIKLYLIKAGQKPGKAELGRAADRSVRTIERYISGEVIPSQHTAFLLAQECGCGEREALDLASECLPERAKETA